MVMNFDGQPIDRLNSFGSYFAHLPGIENDTLLQEEVGISVSERFIEVMHGHDHSHIVLTCDSTHDFKDFDLVS
jgi:hypothetical protein